MSLSEDQIKQIALRFLKKYYKYRPRKDNAPTVAAYDLHTSSGIIVDGYLAFEEPDGKKFMATVEATSWDTRGEVEYKLQKKLIFWDGMAVASLVAALIYVYGYTYNHFTIKQIGLLAGIGLFIGIMLTTWLTYRFFFQLLTRYRYIYAVEQFKKYQANEQWVAIGEDVFSTEENGELLPNPRDKRLQELKKQCVANGFGLVIIGKPDKATDLDAQMLITPARREVVSGRSQVLNYMRNNKLRETVRKTPFLEKIWARTKTVVGIYPTGGGRSLSLRRFERSFMKQIGIAILSLGMVGVIFYREIQDAAIVYVDPNIYQDEMEDLKINVRPEPREFVVDTAAIEDPFWHKKEHAYHDEHQDKLEHVDKDVTTKSNIPKKKDIPTAYAERKTTKVKTTKTDEVLIFTGKDFLSYDCDRLLTEKGNKYVVMEGIYANANLAKRRIRALAGLNITAHTFWYGCYTQDKEGYLVYIESIFENGADAELVLKKNQKRINQKSKNPRKLRFRSLHF